MEEVFIEEKEVFGVGEITNNSLEMLPETSKIMKCWDKLLNQCGSFCEKSTLYGVYTDYERDETKDYQFVAASDAEILAGKNMISVKIPAGGYHKFSFQGVMPDVVIDGWQHIWEFYKSKSEYKRSFDIDFEIYVNGGVDIHIGVQ